MYFEFKFHGLNIMSEDPYDTKVHSSEMLEKYYDDKFISEVNKVFSDTDLLKKGIYVSPMAISKGINLYICFHDSKFTLFIKDKNGFRYDITKQEFNKFLQLYSKTIKSLNAKVTQSFTLDKAIIDKDLQDRIITVLNNEINYKKDKYNYKTFDYIER